MVGAAVFATYSKESAQHGSKDLGLRGSLGWCV